ncbi:MAG TPA: tRNA pseudouridine(55) synthase TruB [Pyrinomonadaceae bacterium]|nr:tRNA pseudouridine(55) synthase TruB [Pyrinomonadaceae bacterium]
MFPMDGALIIDKPAGMTSHDVVARVRTIIGERRVGHTGTLDPFATGVLVVLVGRATRLAQFLSGAEKEYAAVIRLGYATDTGDITGARVERDKSEFHAKAQSTQSLNEETIEDALASLRGEIEQTPPMYSAKKIAGKKLYELARRGQEVERKAVRITIKEFAAITSGDELLKQNDDGTRDLSVRVVCSAGTYVRSLTESVGERLGVGAHVAELRRTRSGQFKIADAITLDRLNDIAQSGSIEQVLLSPDAALAHLPFLNLDADGARRVRHGIDVTIEDAAGLQWPVGQPVRMRDANGNLIAMGIYDQSGRTMHPSVVISDK